MSTRITILILSYLFAIILGGILFHDCKQDTVVVPGTEVHDTTIVTHTQHDTLKVIQYGASRVESITTIHHDTLYKYLRDSTAHVFTGNLIAQSDTSRLTDGGLLVQYFYDRHAPFGYWHKPAPDTTHRSTAITDSKQDITYNIRNKSPTVAVSVGLSPLQYNVPNNTFSFEYQSISLHVGVVLWSY